MLRRSQGHHNAIAAAVAPRSPHPPTHPGAPPSSSRPRLTDVPHSSMCGPSHVIVTVPPDDLGVWNPPHIRALLLSSFSSPVLPLRFYIVSSPIALQLIWSATARDVRRVSSDTSCPGGLGIWTSPTWAFAVTCRHLAAPSQPRSGRHEITSRSPPSSTAQHRQHCISRRLLLQLGERTPAHPGVVWPLALALRPHHEPLLPWPLWIVSSLSHTFRYHLAPFEQKQHGFAVTDGAGASWRPTRSRSYVSRHHTISHGPFTWNDNRAATDCDTDEFQARSPDELSLARGDRIKLVERDDDFGDGWYLGMNTETGDTGLFPEGTPRRSLYHSSSFM